MDIEHADDAAPTWFTHLLMVLWLALLGVRWIATPFIMYGDPEAAAHISDLDRSSLLRCYLILLFLTLLVTGLRFARLLEKRMAPGKQSGASGAPSSNRGGDTR